MSTWDSPQVSELVWAAREAELRLVAALAGGCPVRARPAALRAARELLALQSSDWSFMATRRLAGDYPQRRVAAHRAAFGEALAAFVRAVQDFPAMSADPPDRRAAARGRGDRPETGPQRPFDASLRGLAPGLQIWPLLAPASPWGREPWGRAG
jgi:hypothetical protein